MQRRRLVVGVAAFAALGLAWLVWAGWGDGAEGVTGEVTGYEQVEPGLARTRLAVTAPSGKAVTCTLRALDADDSVVGRATATSPSGGSSRTLEADIKVLTAVDRVEVVECTAP